MTTPCRPCWSNCASSADPEIRLIDEMEDRIAPIPTEASQIRGLISTLELCHHKADRWVTNIVEAIGEGTTRKGLGTRSLDRRHPAETVWENACVALSAWVDGRPDSAADVRVGDVSASELLWYLGKRSPLKEWQVRRVIEKIRSVLSWVQPGGEPATEHTWLLIDAGEHELQYRARCPERYEEHEDFWETTVRTIIHDTVDGDDAELSLALAIDTLWPCHWRFVGNLRIVLGAIGGTLRPELPFAACGRNIGLLPNRRDMEVVSNTLNVFAGTSSPEGELDDDLLAALGEPSDVKKWLALSLEKTIRLQLDPPAELRTIASLRGPDWVYEARSN